MQRSFGQIMISLLLVLLMTGHANAHAVLDHAEPRSGGKVANLPSELVLYFTEKLESAFSSVSVIGPSGQRVDSGKARVSGSRISVSLEGGGAGTYRVIWRVLSVDAHKTDGSFTFVVGP